MGLHKKLWMRFAVGVFVVIASMAWAEETLAQVEQTTQTKPLFGGTAHLTQGLGIGTFVTGYGQNPQVMTTLTMEPVLHLPVDPSAPQMDLKLTMYLNANWVSSYGTSVFDAKYPVSFSDAKVTYAIPKLLSWKDIGLKTGVQAGLIAPVSAASQYLNRVIGGFIGPVVGWSFGEFYAELAPSYTAYAHSSVNKWVLCSDASLPPVAINPHNPDFYLDSVALPYAYPSGEARLGDYCQLAGRQVIGIVGIPFAFSWTHQSHQLYASLSWKLAFLRPLEPNGPASSPNANPSAFKETTLTDVGYSYQLPIKWETYVSLGVMTSQPMFNKAGNFNVPFWDFSSPNQNRTQIYLDFGVGI